jgi:CheY-like chemotaxis protein
MSGYEALAVLQSTEETAHIPVIALSANAMAADIQRGIDAGFFSYLTKPIRVDKFMNNLDLALRQTTRETTHD